MELIHANAARIEQGVIRDLAQFDAEISNKPDAREAENSWQLTLGVDVWRRAPIRPGDYLYIDRTEWGGSVEKISHSTKSGMITLSGVTWRGMLARKIITPPAGLSHLRFEGSAGQLLQELVMPVTDGLFYAPAGGGALSASFRYDNMLGGMVRALSAAGLVLDCRYDSYRRQVIISARPAADYSGSIDLSQDYGLDMVTAKGSLTGYNHVIALGQGELTERTVVDLYRLEDGSITNQRPAWHGMLKDRVATYDYSNAETLEELVKGASARLQEYAEDGSLEMEAADIPMQLGDIVGARDRVTGISMTTAVTGMILKINDNGITIEKKVG